MKMEMIRVMRRRMEIGMIVLMREWMTMSSWTLPVSSLRSTYSIM